MQFTRVISANFCLNFVAVKFLRTAKLVVIVQIAAEAELNLEKASTFNQYYSEERESLTIAFDSGIWGKKKVKMK